MKNENLRNAIWVVGIFALSVWMVLGWLRYPAVTRFAQPVTPFDSVPGLDAGHWRFLQQARLVLPEGEWYTIVSSSPDEEMSLFMIAGGALSEQFGIPTSYYGVPNEYAMAARWVLSYGCDVVPSGARIVTRLDDGCICERVE